MSKCLAFGSRRRRRRDNAAADDNDGGGREQQRQQAASEQEATASNGIISGLGFRKLDGQTASSRVTLGIKPSHRLALLIVVEPRLYALERTASARRNSFAAVARWRLHQASLVLVTQFVVGLTCCYGTSWP